MKHNTVLSFMQTSASSNMIFCNKISSYFKYYRFEVLTFIFFLLILALLTQIYPL